MVRSLVELAVGSCDPYSQRFYASLESFLRRHATEHVDNLCCGATSILDVEVLVGFEFGPIPRETVKLRGATFGQAWEKHLDLYGSHQSGLPRIVDIELSAQFATRVGGTTVRYDLLPFGSNAPPDLVMGVAANVVLAPRWVQPRTHDVRL